MEEKVGLIAGRHLLPVDKYLLEDNLVPGNTAYKAAYEAAYYYLGGLLYRCPPEMVVENMEWGEKDLSRSYIEKRVDLYFYYVDFDEAVLGVLDGFDLAVKDAPKSILMEDFYPQEGIEGKCTIKAVIHIMGWDVDTKDYEELSRTMPVLDRTPWEPG